MPVKQNSITNVSQCIISKLNKNNVRKSLLLSKTVSIYDKLYQIVFTEKISDINGNHTLIYIVFDVRRRTIQVDLHNTII